MVKKLKEMAERQAAASSPLFDSALAGTVKESAQQIWLAGLGAFAKAQEEGGKVFDALVKEGTALQKRTQAAAGEKLGAVGGRVTSMAGGVSAKAGQQWDRLESIFEERTSRALAKLGVPSAKDVQALMARIDALAEKVERLSKATSGTAAPKRTRTRAAADAAAAATGAGAAAPAANGAAKAPARRAAARKAA